MPLMKNNKPVWRRCIATGIVFGLSKLFITISMAPLVFGRGFGLPKLIDPELVKLIVSDQAVVLSTLALVITTLILFEKAKKAPKWQWSLAWGFGILILMFLQGNYLAEQQMGYALMYIIGGILTGLVYRIMLLRPEERQS